MKRLACILLAALLVCLAGCSADSGESGGGVIDTSSAIESGAPVTSAPTATPEETPANINVSYTDAIGGAGQIKLDGDHVELSGNGLSADGNTVTISEGGSYTVTGESDNIQLYVNTSSDVELILAGCSVSCADSAVIYAVKAESLRVTLADGTENYISAFAGAQTLPDEPDAAIYSKADLILGGGGTLTINAALGNGITGKDTLAVTGGNYIINAANNAVKGKDSVSISDGTFALTAGNDGIKATNTDSPTLGYVSITGGSFTIAAGGDGICAESSLIIDGGNFDLVCGGGASNAAPSSGSGGGFFGIQATTSSDEISAKGLKSGADTTISDGIFKLDCADDAIHSNGIVSYNGGNSTIASGDDGLHADATLNINGGTINITSSYEGLEAAAINITGGEISLSASDDGINAADGSSSSAGGRGGMSAGNALLTITGGRITVNAGGDGVDSNGSVVMSGGELYVFGPTDNGNGALDYDSSFNISGGVFVALGSSGMAQTPSASSSQPCISVGTSGSAGDTISVVDASGNIIVSVQSPKTYSSVIISAPSLKIDSTYTVTVGSESYDLTLTSSVTTAGLTSPMGGWAGMGGGGSRPGKGW